ncbi:MAG: ABC transporter ATP-binding protein [Solobacterium sp.]|nr:ABC transporter ATP-binding protein [Solobacterium sp.]
MAEEYAIEVKNIKKSFKVFLDKGNTLKERSLFSKRRKYIERQVLKGISFNAKKGQTIGLIGHNGCGKSTTLKLLTRIMYPDSGEIIMRGRVSSLIELGAGFHPDMSGRENIYINASIFGLTKKEIDERVDSIIAFSELEEFIDNPVRTYSSGMYTRLAFAVAINVNADILLVDEILSVGDENFQQKCYEKMKELKASGITIILVTHSLGTVRSFCDWAIWINEGEIAAEGKPNKVVDTYLHYMNKLRMENINEQAAEEAPQEEVPIEEEASEETPPEEWPVRYGNQRAIMKDCRLVNKDGKEVKGIYANEDFCLEIDYEIKDPTLDEIIFGMGIFCLDDVWVFGTNTKMAGYTIKPNGKKEGTVRFSCGPLMLQNDIYKLQCSIIEEDGKACDFSRDYLRFNVVNPAQGAGIVRYDNKWDLGDLPVEEE